MSQLVVKGLTAGYGKLTVLRDISFAVNPGQISVILGANGAGKTTTLRAICGLTVSRGEVVFEGQQIGKWRTERISRLGVAQVPQGRGTFTDFTVEENLDLGAYGRRDAAGVRADKEYWFDFFPRLRERRRQRAGSLSGGEQQMLAVARALMMRPKLLLLDEPSLGLAPVVVIEVFRILTEVNREKGTTMLIVEQNADLALDTASYAYVLESGRIVLEGEAARIKQEENVRRVYLGY